MRPSFRKVGCDTKCCCRQIWNVSQHTLRISRSSRGNNFLWYYVLSILILLRLFIKITLEIVQDVLNANQLMNFTWWHGNYSNQVCQSKSEVTSQENLIGKSTTMAIMCTGVMFSFVAESFWLNTTSKIIISLKDINNWCLTRCNWW